MMSNNNCLSWCNTFPDLSWPFLYFRPHKMRAYSLGHRLSCPFSLLEYPGTSLARQSSEAALAFKLIHSSFLTLFASFPLRQRVPISHIFVVSPPDTHILNSLYLASYVDVLWARHILLPLVLACIWQWVAILTVRMVYYQLLGDKWRLTVATNL